MDRNRDSAPDAYGMVPVRVIDALADEPRALALYVAMVAIWADRDGHAKPSLATVAERLGWGNGTVRRALSILKARGIVTTRQYHRPMGLAHAGTWGVNHYRLTVVARDPQSTKWTDRRAHTRDGPSRTGERAVPARTGERAGTIEVTHKAPVVVVPVADDDDDGRTDEPNAALVTSANGGEPRGTWLAEDGSDEEAVAEPQAVAEILARIRQERGWPIPGNRTTRDKRRAGPNGTDPNLGRDVMRSFPANVVPLRRGGAA